jgi:hypothetical protein
LSAYRLALGEDVACANILFSSTEDLQIKLHKWDEQELAKAKPAFLGILAYWQWANKYYPHIH